MPYQQQFMSIDPNWPWVLLTFLFLCLLIYPKLIKRVFGEAPEKKKAD